MASASAARLMSGRRESVPGVALHLNRDVELYLIGRQRQLVVLYLTSRKNKNPFQSGGRAPPTAGGSSQ